jgi:hypothetical protein
MKSKSSPAILKLFNMMQKFILAFFLLIFFSCKKMEHQISRIAKTITLKLHSQMGNVQSKR